MFLSVPALAHDGHAAAAGLVLAAAINLFALLHSHAHGVELPEVSSSILYGVGFVVATLALHTIGLAISMAATGKTLHNAVRLLGAAIAAAGTYLLVAAG